MDEETRTRSWAFESADGQLKIVINDLIEYLKEHPRDDGEIEKQLKEYLGEYELLRDG